MSQPAVYDVTGIGNACIDITAIVSDDFLNQRGFIKGQCVYIDVAVAMDTEKSLETPVYVPGGAAANTMAGIAALGGRTAMIGMTTDDPIGILTRQSMADAGIDFPVPAQSRDDLGSTRIFCLATPDGERSFAACYGIALDLGPKNIPEETLKRTKILHLDGFGLVAPAALEAYDRAIAIVRASGGRVSFNPNDLSVLQNYPDAVTNLLDTTDIVICNEHESCRMTGHGNARDSLLSLTARGKTVAITAGADGAMVGDASSMTKVPVISPSDPVIDTNGAGDAFAAGFLYGLTRGLTLEKGAILGTRCAATVITRLGARPPRDLASALAGL